MWQTCGRPPIIPGHFKPYLNWYTSFVTSWRHFRHFRSNGKDDLFFCFFFFLTYHESETAAYVELQCCLKISSFNISLGTWISFMAIQKNDYGILKNCSNKKISLMYRKLHIINKLNSYNWISFNVWVSPMKLSP